MRPVAPIEVIILAALILLPLAVYFTWKSTARCRPKIRILSTICRLLTFTALIILALNPGTWQEQRHQKSGQWAILIDRSASMQTTAAGPDKTTSRFDEALRLAQAGLALAPDPDAVRIFTFDSDLTPASLDSLPALTPGDATTDIPSRILHYRGVRGRAAVPGNHGSVDDRPVCLRR